MVSDYLTIVVEKILCIIGSGSFLFGCNHHLKDYWRKVQNSILFLTYLFSFPADYHYLCNYPKWGKRKIFFIEFSNDGIEKELI